MEFSNFKEPVEKSPEYLSRLESWKEMTAAFEESEDEVDFDDFEFEGSSNDEIDGKIKELVVGLNIIGLRTHYSCEGHYDGISRTLSKGGIGSDGREYLEKIENPPIEGSWRHPYCDFSPENQSYERWDAEKRKAIAGVRALIDEFYQNCERLPEIRVRIKKRRTRYSNYEITACDRKGTERLSDTDNYAELERLAMERIRKEREEIVRFGEFIKEKYLQTGFHI